MTTMKGTQLFYRKKPVVIEARQLTKDNIREVTEWMLGAFEMSPDLYSMYEKSVLRNGLIVPTLEDGTGEYKAEHIASIGDFIIKGVMGEFYPCKPDIFEMTYERADDVS